MPYPSPTFVIPRRCYGLLGHPVGHSLSPALHNWSFQREATPAVYMAWDIHPDNLSRFMDAVRLLRLAGLSVTIPHKEAVTPFLDETTPRAQRAGAVNTLFWREDRLVGDNTDVDGLLAPLQEAGVDPTRALVLGAGGAARAALTALTELKVPHVAISNRSRERAEALAEAFDVEVVPWDERVDAQPDLLINTTPMGMAGDLCDVSPWPAEALQPKCLVYDIVYNPLRTRLLLDARRAGCRIIDGLAMFIEQARAQQRLWTGRACPPDLARDLLLQALREHEV